MHRGRLSWDWDAEAGKWRRVRIELGPDKTDPSGEQGYTVHLPFDDNAEINAAAAVAHMLKGVSEVSSTRFPLIKKSGLLTPGHSRSRAIRTRWIHF